MLNYEEECNCIQTNTESEITECNLNLESEEEMLNQIRNLNFTLIELGLYLDTHPDDIKALGMHKEYFKQLRDIQDRYQRMYGPLTWYYPSKQWSWLDEPWPWEGGN